MNPPPPPQEDLPPMSREELMSALFANLVVQQSNMALMFLGKVPHPETGQSISDPESAQMMIDQLEMLEVKTRGNLDKRETALLQQSLTTLRLAFVDTVEPGDTAPVVPTKAAAGPASPAAAQTLTPAAGPAGESATAPSDQEPRRKFSKKY